MAKSGRAGRRALPSTPAPRSPSAGDPTAPEGGTSAPGASPDGSARARGSGVPAQPASGAPARSAKPGGTPSREPDYLIAGTGCTAGHPRGHELDAGRLGTVPSRRATRIGVFLVLWCAVGLGLVVDSRWLSFGIQMLLLWLAFSAIVQRRAGHRGHCWRTRTWRHAWGGLAPGGTSGR